MQVTKNKIAIAVLAAAILLVIWLLSAGMSDSPKKSLLAIEKAIKKHDVETFEKYVDLQSFYSEGFDAFLLASIKWERPDEEVSIADMGFMMMFKAPVVHELTAASKQAIEKGETPNAGSFGELENTVNTLGVTAWELKRVGSSKKRSVTAIVPVTIHDRQVGKDFVFEIELHKTDEGVWRVKKVANAETLILARMAAAKSKLDEVNADILKELAKAIEVSNEKFAPELLKNSFYSSRCVTSFSAKNKRDKDIASFGAKITIYDVNGEALFSYTGSWSDSKAGLLGAGKQGTFSAEKYLRQHEYDKLSKEENKGGKIMIDVTYVKFSDGTELRELSKLPPYEKK